MENIIEKRSQLKTVVLLIVFTFLFLFSVFAINQSLNQTNSSSQDIILNIPVLAETVNGKSIYTPYFKIYYEHYNNFSDINFKEVKGGPASVSMKIGNFNHKLEGLILDNEKYVVELIICDKETNTCEFRINGIPTGKIQNPKGKQLGEPASFALSDNYELKINSVTFGFCDHKRFCDRHFEAYDLIEAEVVEIG